MRPLARRLAAAVNRTDARNGVPLQGAPAFTPRQHERWFSWTHYGVMVPGLPEPHRRFGVMAILGTTGVAVFDNDPWIRTTPRDTAYVVSGTATDGGFAAYSMREQCAFAEDGSSLVFGDRELVLEGLPPRVRVRRPGAVPVDLELEVTDRVAWFSRIPGVYDHVSLLARVRGTVGEVAVDTLGTWEYARGAGAHSVLPRSLPGWAKTPIRAFTYQVLDVGPEDQLLLTAAGPRFGLHVHEGAWERGLDDPGAMHRDVAFTVDEHRATPLVTPDGRRMRMPERWRWTVRDDGGAERTRLACRALGDWTYGLGAGWVGSFAFQGEHRGASVAGTAYVEWVELSPVAGAPA